MPRFDLAPPPEDYAGVYALIYSCIALHITVFNLLFNDCLSI
jgi:hypothetical protein